MTQDRITVGPYTFVQASEVESTGRGVQLIPIPNTFAVPGGTYASRQQIESFAKRNSYKVIKEQ
jgi:hypothetical protein